MKSFFIGNNMQAKEEKKVGPKPEPIKGIAKGAHYTAVGRAKGLKGSRTRLMLLSRREQLTKQSKHFFRFHFIAENLLIRLSILIRSIYCRAHRRWLARTFSATAKRESVESWREDNEWSRSASGWVADKRTKKRKSCWKNGNFHRAQQQRRADFNFWLTRNYFSIYKFRFLSLGGACLLNGWMMMRFQMVSAIQFTISSFLLSVCIPRLCRCKNVFI